MKQSAAILAPLILFSLAVTGVDAFLHPDYFAKICVKIVFFLALPLIYFFFAREDLAHFKRLFAFRKKGLLPALLLGLGVYGVILGGYFLLRGIIDFSGVTSSLEDGMGITAENFILVSLYISLANSFLEEFFFRGFGFMTLKRHIPRPAAYLLSASLFAIYHVGMLVGMFALPALLLLLLGLIIGGCLFSWLNEKTESLYPSWLTHMFANFAIQTVGMVLFGLI